MFAFILVIDRSEDFFLGQRFFDPLVFILVAQSGSLFGLCRNITKFRSLVATYDFFTKFINAVLSTLGGAKARRRKEKALSMP